MSKTADIRLKQIANSINKLHSTIKVPSTFSGQVTAVDCLLNNDQTGLVRPLIDLMVDASTVPMKLETKNDTMNAILLDWAELIKTVMRETMKRNRDAHPKLASNQVSVIPGVNKTFMTDEMKSCIKNWADRGLISIQSAVESTTDFDIHVEAERRDREEKMGWNELFFPRQIQNNGQDPEKMDNTPPDRDWET